MVCGRVPRNRCRSGGSQIHATNDRLFRCFRHRLPERLYAKGYPPTFEWRLIASGRFIRHHGTPTANLLNLS